MKEKVLKLIDGMSFEQLVEVMEGLEANGVYDAEIHDPIVDKMIEVDEDKFIEWEEKYNN